MIFHFPLAFSSLFCYNRNIEYMIPKENISNESNSSSI